jgi:teichuronic acid biosynthesis glycosyltransferase TuaC
MKVLFVSSGNANKGISPIVERQGASLINEGIDLDFFTIKGKGVKSYLENIIILKKLIKSTNYQIIHAHYGLSALVAKLAKKKEKLIVSFMGDDLIGSRNSIGKISAQSKLFVKINAFFSFIFYDYSIVKSFEMKKKLRSKNVSVIPNGVNFDTFFPKDKSEALKEVLFSPVKINVIFVSDPTRSEKNFLLAKQAIELLKDDKIELHSIYGISSFKLANYYNAADLLLMTSFHEGSPNVIKEAMACGCPVVCTNVGDVEWLFEDTKGNFLTNYDPIQVANHVKDAITYRVENHFTNGRQRLIDLGLDSKSVANNIINIYHQVLQK